MISVPDHIEGYLPEDPEPYEVVKLPDGVFGGERVTITLFNTNNNPIGEAQRLNRIPNVSGVWKLESVYCDLKDSEVLKNSILRICVSRRMYISMIFLDNIGWVGHHTTPAEILSNHFYKVMDCTPNLITKTMSFIDIICLKKCKEEPNEKTTT